LNGITYGLIGGFAGGSIFIVFTGSYDYIFRRRIFSKYKTKSFNLKQKREFFLSGDIRQIFQISIAALEKIHKIKNISPDFDAYKISAETGASKRTFGERIELSLFQEHDKIKVYILSKPRLKTAIFDCGKNIENVEIFSSILKSAVI
jgi:hypothetical protein